MESGSLEDIMKRLVEIEARVSKLEQLQSVKGINPEDFPLNSEKKLSIREFVNLISPKNSVEKVLAIAYYKEVIQSITPFTVKDIADGFKESKEPAPDNINLPIYYNVQKGYLMENNSSESKLKSWELTNTGIKVVKERMNGNQA
jgi:hypothetical protein